MSRKRRHPHNKLEIAWRINGRVGTTNMYKSQLKSHFDQFTSKEYMVECIQEAGSYKDENPFRPKKAGRHR